MKTVFEKYYSKLSISGTNMVLKKEYEDYLNAIKKLDDTFKEFDIKNNAWPVLTAEDVVKIRDGYQKMFDLGRKFLSEAKNKKAGRDKTFKQRIALVMTAEKRMTESSMAFAGAVSPEGMTIPEIMDTIRGREIEVDEKTLGGVGGLMSLRMPMEFTTKSGKKVEGYFSQYTDSDFKRDRDELINRVSCNNKELKEIFEKLFANDKFMGLINCSPLEKENKIVEFLGKSKFEDNMRMAPVLGYVYNKKNIYDPENAFWDNHKGKIQKIANDKNVKNLTESVITFIREAPSIMNRHDMNVKAAKMVGRAKIEDRNAAMSAVADLLGCPNIIARATKMSVMVNGKRTEGVFMEKAEGTDVNTESGKKLFEGYDGDKEEKEYYSQLADLQILDFICGNIDRRIPNLIYKTEKDEEGNIVISGLKGIDNDTSFGVLDGKTRVNCLPAIDELKVINEEMAGRVMMITPEHLSLVLKPYHLDNKEIKAAQNRLKLVKEKIVEARKVQKENEAKKENKTSNFKIAGKGYWGKYDPRNDTEICFSVEPEDGNYLNADGNYFYNLVRLQNKVSMYSSNIVSEQTVERLKSYDKYGYKFPDNLEVKTAEGREAGEAKFTKNSAASFSMYLDEINSATAYRGTKEYQNIADYLTELKAFAGKISEKSDLVDWKLLEGNYKKLEENIDTYLDRKENERIKLYAKGKAPSADAERREEAMRKAKRFLQVRREAARKYINSKLNENVAQENLQNEVEQLKLKAKKGHVTDTMLSKLVVKQRELAEMASGKTITCQKEYSEIVNLSKKDSFKRVLADLNNRGTGFDLDNAVEVLKAEVGELGVSDVKKSSEAENGIVKLV